MKLFRVGALFLLAAGAAACSVDNGGSVVVPDSLAALRYMNLVADTGAVDFRIIDIVAWAPNQTAATFRTGGFVDGISLGGNNPVYMPVAAGTRHIRVFLNGGSPSVSSQQLLDTTYTFASNTNYTFYLYGYAHSPTNGTPALNARITVDSAQTIPNTCPAAGAAPLTTCKFFTRVIDLAPTMAPTLASAAVDVWVDTLALGAIPVGAPTFSNVNFGDVRAYSSNQVRTAVTGPPAVAQLNYRVVVAATTTTTPIFNFAVPAGTVGNSTTQPVPGALVGGTGVSIVLVPRSVAATAAPQTAAFQAPAGLLMFDQLPPRTAP